LQNGRDNLYILVSAKYKKEVEAMAMNNPQGNTPQRKGWFGRNWKWFVPVGCLGIISIIVVFVVGIVVFVFGAIKSSDVYQDALKKAQANPVVKRELGEPIEPGWMVSGSINTGNGGGNADLQIPISGPKKGATIYAVAGKRAGSWNYTSLDVVIDGQTEKINLLTSP
jgi:cytochrome oxidase complex assembly protein 1